MLSSYNPPLISTEDYQKHVDTPEWNMYIRKNTRFSSYQEMLNGAGTELAKKKLSKEFH